MIKIDEALIKPVESLQEWNGKKIKFDPDSSPVAFEHYNKIYSNLHWSGINDYNLNTPIFFNSYKKLDLKCGLYRNGSWYNYLNLPFKHKINRLNAISLNENAIIYKNKEYYMATSRLSGDTDFDFKTDENPNKNKYGKFLNLLKGSFKDEILIEHIAKLNECKNMHNTLINFSLMQVMGNLQRAKSKGINNEWLDRLDSFIYLIREYYRTDYNDRDSCQIILNSTYANKNTLRKFLDDFIDVYDYCNNIYFIKDKTFVEKLIEEGQKPMNSGERVVEYMELAFDFWEKKNEGIKNVI